MDIQSRELGLERIRQILESGQDMGATLRSKDGPFAWVTKFHGVPWVSVLLAAPVDHVWCDMPEGTVNGLYLPQAPTAGPAQTRWMTQQSKESVHRKSLLAELRVAGINPSLLPHGLLGFDGGAVFGGANAAFGKAVPALSEQWFRAFLIPQDDSRQRLCINVLTAMLNERGSFALRPCSDSALVSGQYAGHFSPEDDRLEAYLFSQYYQFPHPLGKPAVVAERIVQAISNQLEAESVPLEFDSVSMAFLPRTSVNLPLADYSRSSVMDIPRRYNDTICSLRLRLVANLGWPVFAMSLKAAQHAVSARALSARPLVAHEVDVKVSLARYWAEMKRRFPLSVSWPLDAVWAPG